MSIHKPLMPLFNPIIEEKLQHHNFRSILAAQNGFNLDVINNWANGFIGRDGDSKFIKEFQISFNSCFWELYLFAILKKYGLEVDFRHSRPDFYIPSKNLNIEATVALHPNDSLPEYSIFHELPTDLNLFNNHSIIRLSNSIISKYKQFIESYKQLAHVKDRAFIIAITDFSQPHRSIACHRPIEALLYNYYIDEESFINNKEKNLNKKNLFHVQKNGGAPIELGIFTTSKYKEISAIIFSNCATWGKVRALSADPNPFIYFNALRSNNISIYPDLICCKKLHYQENLLDGLRVYHNPFAMNPIDFELFRNRSVFQSYYTNKWVYEQSNGLLISRSVRTINKK